MFEFLSLNTDMKLSFKNFAGIVAAALLNFGCPFSGLAASTNVTVGFSGHLTFSPTNTTINTGDQVIWTWAGANHSSTSGTNGVAGDDNGVPGGLWDSGVLTAGKTFTNTFNSAGNFSYYCSVHFASHMTGMVFVVTGNLPPTLSITNPVSGTVLAAPASVKIQVTVTNGSSAVTNVQFLVGANVLTNETVAPFSAITNNLAAGSYALSAVASDNNGLKATNVVTINVVTPATVSLTNSAKLSSTNIQFSYLVNTGLSYVVQRSTNLAATNWISLVTNVAASNPIVFMDNHATNNPGFYRVGRLPNP